MKIATEYQSADDTRESGAAPDMISFILWEHDSEDELDFSHVNVIARG